MTPDYSIEEIIVEYEYDDDIKHRNPLKSG